MLRLPSTATVFAAGLAGVMVVIVLAKGLTDPDFFTHVRTGQLIVDTVQIPTTDPFSFTWNGQPWTLHEWLSEVRMYLLISSVGALASLILFGLIPGTLLAILAFALIRRGVPLRPVALACVLSAWVFIPYVTIRPQAISWLFMAILLVFLWGLGPERPRRALWLIPLFVAVGERPWPVGDRAGGRVPVWPVHAGRSDTDGGARSASLDGRGVRGLPVRGDAHARRPGRDPVPAALHRLGGLGAGQHPSNGSRLTSTAWPTWGCSP